MPSPSKKIPQSATPTKLPLIPGQSTIEGFLSVSKPLNARNDDDVNNADTKATATNPPLKRKRRICDDDAFGSDWETPATTYSVSTVDGKTLL